MYLDLIYKSLPKITEAELNQIGKTELNEILNKIESKFENEAEELINIGEDCKNLKNEEVDEGQKRMFFIQKFFKKRINERQFLRIKNKAQHKLKNQKKVIRQARKGEVPRKPTNVKTQALKAIRPIDNMGAKVRGFISKMSNGIKGILKPKKYKVLESQISDKEAGIAENLKIDSNENNEERNNRKNEFYHRIRVKKLGITGNSKKDKKLIEENTNENTNEKTEEHEGR